MKAKIPLIVTLLFIISFFVALYACNAESTFLTSGNLDARVYGHTATSIASGTVFIPFIRENGVVPTSHYPPFYPLVLSALMKTGVSLDSSKAFVCMAGFSLTITLIFIQCLFLTKDKHIPSAIACSFFAFFSVAIYAVFFHAMSETVFIPLLMLSIFTLGRHIEGGGIKMLFISCVSVSLLPITRYLGIAAIASNCLALCLPLGNRKTRLVYKRFRDASIYGLFACIPGLLWFVYMSYTNTIRNDHFEPDLFARLLEPISCIWYHFIPFGMPFYVQAIFSVIFVIAFTALCYISFNRKNHNLFRLNADLSVWALFLIVYAGLLIVMTFVTGEPWPFAERILVPYQIAFFLVLSIFIRKMLTLQSIFLKYGFFAILFCYTPLAVYRAFYVLHQYHLCLK